MAKQAKTVANQLGISVEEVLRLADKPDGSERSHVEFDEVAEALRAEQEDGLDTAGDVLGIYRSSGLDELQLYHIEQWFPGLSPKRGKLRGSRQLNEEEAKQLIELLDVLLAISYRLEADKQALEQWQAPDIGTLLQQQGNYRYRGICGHQVEMSHEVMQRRLENPNPKVPPIFRLCTRCRAERTALLDMVPGAAHADSVCRVCREPTFDTGARGHALSRGDLWENLLSEVMGVLNLPQRLDPNHPPHHRKHKQLARSRKTFEDWRKRYELEVSVAISQYPEMGPELKKRMEEDIEGKRQELGLPDNDKE